MINLKLKPVVFAVVSVIAATSSVYAADKATAKTDIKADKVIVNGILPDRLEAVPGSFNVIDQKQLVERRPFSVKEALNNTAGINIVGEDSMGFGLNIGMRGLDPRRTSRTLLMEDGMPLFLAPYGDPSAHYSTPLDRIDRIEVVKGSGQIVYGPQTVGGMINFVTKPVPRKGFAGSATAIFGNNDFNSQHLNLGTGNERGGFMIDAIKKRGDGIRDYHKFDVEEYTLKGEVDLTDKQSLMAKLGYYKEDSNITETMLGESAYAQDKFQANSGKNDGFVHERKSAQVKHIFKITDDVKLTTNAYYADAYRSSFRQTDEPTSNNVGLERCPGDAGEGNGNFTTATAATCGGRHRPRSYNFFGFEPRLDIKHSLFGLESDAVVGMRYHEEDIKRQQFRGDTANFQSLSFAKANSLAREDIDIKVNAMSYYLQNTFYAGNWSVTPGIRYEDLTIKTDINRANGNSHNNAESNLNNSQSKVLPGLGVAWNGIANTTIFAGVHKGFAPPRPDRDISAGGANTAVVSKTKPEESTNWEIGVRTNYFKGINANSTLFLTDFDDVVVQAPTAGRFFNGGKSRQSGIELAGRVDFGTIYDTPHNIYLTANYTGLFTAKFTKDVADEGIQNGNRMPYAPRDIASVNLGYQHPVGFNARIGLDYVGQQHSNVANDRTLSVDGTTGTIPSFTLLNASVSFKPVGSKLTYFVSGHNLADKEYLQSRVDGMSVGRGRQVFGGVTIAF